MADLIIAKVTHRWKQAASPSWINDATAMDAEDAISNLRADFRRVKGYKAKCAYLAQIYRKLAGPLETPKIAEYADLIEKRVIDVDQLMGLLQGSDQLINKAVKEFDQLIDHLAKGGKLRGGYIEAVYDLPSIDALFKKAQKADEIQSPLHVQDNEVEIDWTLEEYLGVEAKIYSKIERTGGELYGWFAGTEFTGVWALYGFLKYVLELKLEELVEYARGKLDK